MHAWETIERSLDFIEAHLEEEVTIETMADMAALSPFYFQRLFKRLVHKPVQEYIKLRRLAKAAGALQATSRRILDVALDHGFSSHANFTRAFKETYGITPEEYRKKLPMLNTFDRPEISMSYVLIGEGVPLVINDIVLEIDRKILTAPELYIGLEAEISILEQTPIGEATSIDMPGQLWRQYHVEKATVAPGINSEIELGMSYSANSENGTFLYFVGGPAERLSNHIWKDAVQRELPAGEYIVCKIEAENFEKLVTTALNQAGKYLFGTWLPHHNLTTHPFSAEKYYHTLDVAYMEIWVAPLPILID